MRQMVWALSMRGKDQDFIEAHERTTQLAQSILKAEWNRTKAGH
jgi:hypothetical protein